MDLLIIAGEKDRCRCARDKIAPVDKIANSKFSFSFFDIDFISFLYWSNMQLT